MFKKFAALQWTWFFVLVIVIVIDVILSNSNSWNMFSTDYGNEISKLYWSGLVVVFWTWLIKFIAKKIRRKECEKL